ncbi:hypothetical protein [Nocardia sp. NBC_01388]|uniref:hypothetical protein n=1 Tax=Nocardia sp. NBC_01388 TaxID=2903596 RepID=UPI00324E9705
MTHLGLPIEDRENGSAVGDLLGDKWIHATPAEFRLDQVMAPIRTPFSAAAATAVAIQRRKLHDVLSVSTNAAGALTMNPMMDTPVTRGFMLPA